MLYRADILYKYCELHALQSDPAVKIHGALMNNISSELSEYLHKPDYHPFSIYCVPTDNDEFFLRISALTDQTSEIIDALCNMKRITLFGSFSPIFQENIQLYKPVHYTDISNALSSDTLTLSFLTPAVYRSKGRFRNPPAPEKYFYSVICKLNAFENLDIDYNAFLEAWEKCEILDFMLESGSHAITGKSITGMLGRMTISIPKNHPDPALIKTILSYAAYSGLGAKTALGMGGFTVLPAEDFS